MRQLQSETKPLRHWLRRLNPWGEIIPIDFNVKLVTVRYKQLTDAAKRFLFSRKRLESMSLQSEAPSYLER
jgi:hypothetical protein